MMRKCIVFCNLNDWSHSAASSDLFGEILIHIMYVILIIERDLANLIML